MFQQRILIKSILALLLYPCAYGTIFRIAEMDALTPKECLVEQELVLMDPDLVREYEQAVLEAPELVRRNVALPFSCRPKKGTYRRQQVALLATGKFDTNC